MTATSAGRGRATATTGVTSKSLTGIQNRSRTADDPDARRHRVEADLLGRLAQGGRDHVGVLGLGLAAREADLAGVVAVAVGRSMSTTRASPTSSG